MGNQHVAALNPSKPTLLMLWQYFHSQEKEEAEEAPPAGSAAAPKAASQMRIVSYFGHWLCDCGRENALWDRCSCGQVPPWSSSLTHMPPSHGSK